jgi:hypothetical protein
MQTHLSILKTLQATNFGQFLLFYVFFVRLCVAPSYKVNDGTGFSTLKAIVVLEGHRLFTLIIIFDVSVWLDSHTVIQTLR